MLIQMLTGFRLEYFWTFHLCINHLVEIYKTQGLILASAFLVILSTGSAVALSAIPTDWQLSLGSTAVWISLLFYSGTGFSLPSLGMSMVLAYFEIFVRHNLEILKCPYGFNFLAIHSITFPMIQLCFYLKNQLVSYLRIRNQKFVASQNLCYIKILESALPEELWVHLKKTVMDTSNCLCEVARGVVDNHNESSKIGSSVSNPSNHYNVVEIKPKHKHDPGRLKTRVNGEVVKNQPISVESYSCNEVSKGMSCINKASSMCMQQASDGINECSSKNGSNSNGTENNTCSNGNTTKASDSSVEYSGRQSTSNGSSGGDGNREKGSGDKLKSSCQINDGNSVPKNKSGKDEVTLKLESEIRDLRSELQHYRSLEADLSLQMVQATAHERSMRSECAQVKAEYDSLKSKLKSIMERSETDKKSLAEAEHRLAEEKKLKENIEQQYMELTNNSSVQVCQTTPNNKSGKAAKLKDSVQQTSASSVTCVQRLKRLEQDLKSLNRELLTKESQLQALKNPSNSNCTSVGNGSLGSLGGADHLRRCEQELNELSSKLSHLKDDNTQMSITLKEQDKEKQDLIAAYLSSLRDSHDLICFLRTKEDEVVELKSCLNNISPMFYDFQTHANGTAATHSHAPATMNGYVSSARSPFADTSSQSKQPTASQQPPPPPTSPPTTEHPAPPRGFVSGMSINGTAASSGPLDAFVGDYMHETGNAEAPTTAVVGSGRPPVTPATLNDSDMSQQPHHPLLGQHPFQQPQQQQSFHSTSRGALGHFTSPNFEGSSAGAEFLNQVLCRSPTKFVDSLLEEHQSGHLHDTSLDESKSHQHQSTLQSSAVPPPALMSVQVTSTSAGAVARKESQASPSNSYNSSLKSSPPHSHEF